MNAQLSLLILRELNKSRDILSVAEWADIMHQTLFGAVDLGSMVFEPYGHGDYPEDFTMDQSPYDDHQYYANNNVKTYKGLEGILRGVSGSIASNIFDLQIDILPHLKEGDS